MAQQQSILILCVFVIVCHLLQCHRYITHSGPVAKRCIKRHVKATQIFNIHQRGGKHLDACIKAEVAPREG